MKANSTSSVCLVGHHVVVTESSIDRGRRDAMRYSAPSTYQPSTPGVSAQSEQSHHTYAYTT